MVHYTWKVISSINIITIIIIIILVLYKWIIIIITNIVNIIIFMTVFDSVYLVLVCPGSTVGDGWGKVWMTAAQSASWWPSWCTALLMLTAVRDVSCVYACAM